MAQFIPMGGMTAQLFACKAGESISYFKNETDSRTGGAYKSVYHFDAKEDCYVVAPIGSHITAGEPQDVGICFIGLCYLSGYYLKEEEGSYYITLSDHKQDRTKTPRQSKLPLYYGTFSGRDFPENWGGTPLLPPPFADIVKYERGIESAMQALGCATQQEFVY